MAKVKRPTGVTVLAVLNLVFGIFALIGMAVTAVGLAAFNVQPAPLPERPAEPTDPIGVVKETSQFIMNECPSYKTVQLAGIAVGGIDAVLLIASGIGLLKLQKWARSLCFVYVVLALAFTALSTAYQFTAIVPATEKYEKERNEKLKALGKPVPPTTAAVTATASAGFGAFCGFLYPVIVIGLLLAPSTRAAFSGKLPVDDERDREDDLDDDRPLRRGDDDDDRPRDDDNRFRTSPDR